MDISVVTSRGTLDAGTNNGIKAFLVGCGLASATENVPTEITPKMLKALMTLDAYSLIGSGTASIREAQQWINGKYQNRKLPILPCDGIFTRSTQQGLMTAIQYELLLTDSQANGNFGPSTKSGLAAQGNVSSGSIDGTRNWVRLFQCALRFNGYDAPLTGTFNAATVSATNAFQSYAELGATGAANFTTWASLLISTGDETRPGTASDMASQLTASWCNSLYANGDRTVGRYLSVLGKRYAPESSRKISNAGLKTFPIMQESNTGPNDFSYEKGLDHGLQALRRLRQLGFKDGTTVFFAVDFDALDDTITSRVKSTSKASTSASTSHSRTIPSASMARGTSARASLMTGSLTGSVHRFDVLGWGGESWVSPTALVVLLPDLERDTGRHDSGDRQEYPVFTS